MDKPFTEMTSRELFCVLTGERGIMQQNIIKEYLAKYEDDADLVTMVRVIAEQDDAV